MSLKNKKILITCGPTWVPIDDMRIISNLSTGRLGQMLGQELDKKGARVTILEGPVSQPLAFPKIRILKFHFFDELTALLNKELKKNYDIVIHAAAVSDYRLKKVYKNKLSSGIRELNLTLVPTVKIINQIKKAAPDIFLIGFKLESTSNKKILLQKSKKIFRDAKCNLLIANSLRKGYCGYIVDSSEKILAEANSRALIVKKLVNILEAHT